jgi:hydroxymethylpyrimidine pyrophosphatase-like HAD family hydrolase
MVLISTFSSDDIQILLHQPVVYVIICFTTKLTGETRFETEAPSGVYRHSGETIFDIDGTAIPNGAKAVGSQRLIHAMGLAHEADIVMIAATGRSTKYALPIISTLTPHDETWAITSNGGVIYRGGEEQWRHPIDEGDIASIIDIAAEHAAYGGLRLAGDPEDQMIGPTEQRARETTGAFLQRIRAHDTQPILDAIAELGQLHAYKLPAWGGEGFDINIGHRLATKARAIGDVCLQGCFDRQ